MRAQLKKVLKFYYSAEGVNRALDGAIARLAQSSWRDAYGGEHAFEGVWRVVEIKAELSGLWAELDGIIGAMPQRDRRSLKRYAYMRVGIASLGDGERRELHRALVKFRRRLGGLLERQKSAYRLLCEYYIFLVLNE